VFEDLVALVALYRPGPMENIPKYVACKHGRDKPEFMHETIDPVVKDTYGIIIYQEQVLQIAQVFAGYSLGQADILRRAMGKKIKEEMAAERARFVEGAVKKGINAKQASYVFDLVDKFAGYGFNKAHSAGYALVAYYTAYLKANHPVEFFAATMTLAMANSDKLNQFRQELAKIGVPVLPPDVNRSKPEFSVEYQEDGKPAVRYALAAVKNVGIEAMRGMVAERDAKGPFRDLADFARRIDNRVINKRQLENLVSAGAFDGFGKNRAAMFAAVEAVIRMAGSAASDRESGQGSLLGGAPGGEALVLPKIGDWPINEKLQKEFEAIGFYLSAHPLDAYEKAMKRLGVVPQVELARRVGSEVSRIKLAGIVLGKQERVSARGNRFAFVQMSDTTGAFEVTLFSEALAAAKDLLTGGKPVVITCEARPEEGGGIRLMGQQVQALDEIATKTAAGMRVILDDARPIADLKKAISTPGGGRVSFVIPMPDSEVEVLLKGGYVVSPQLRALVEAMPGVAEVQEL
jgi:DNA polymerase-3 subunit alpha